jgi:hypothetical protein
MGQRATLFCSIREICTADGNIIGPFFIVVGCAVECLNNRSWNLGFAGCRTNYNIGVE